MMPGVVVSLEHLLTVRAPVLDPGPQSLWQVVGQQVLSQQIKLCISMLTSEVRTQEALLCNNKREKFTVQSDMGLRRCREVTDLSRSRGYFFINI